MKDNKAQDGGESASLSIDHLDFDGGSEPRLVIGGTVSLPDSSAYAVAGKPVDTAPFLIDAQLVGPRQRLEGTVTLESGRWEATFPLTLSRWNGPTLPIRSGRYLLNLVVQGAPQRAELCTPVPGRQLLGDLLGVACEAVNDSPEGSSQAGSLIVLISPPLTAQEFGPANQRQLEARYRATTYAPIDAVFLESFYGQNASCNPLGIDRALAELLPETTRYWSVVDGSVEVPPGATAIVEGSELWWRIRGAARLLVVNDWLRKRYKKRRHQRVLQTWHGTPLKKIALSRPRTGLRSTIATILEGSRWDVLLAQNPHSARVFRRAYAYSGPIWQEGYPRNDILVSGDPAIVRQRLGIADGITVLLYAPTWRDDRPGHVDHLEVAEFAENLGEGYLTLIRGHSRSLKPGEDVVGNRVLDVTAYPDVSDLFLVADALITDYSSVMFDFSVTGKPLFFFAPDLAHYRKKLRGFYFDLSAGTPGPIISSAADLVALIRDRDTVHARFSEAYARWQERFNARDDGAAGRRIVQRLVRQGILGSKPGAS